MTTKRIAFHLTLLAMALVALPACAQSAEPGAAPETEPAERESEAALAATVGGEPITEAELRDAAKAKLVSIRQQEYQALSETLQQLIADRLLEAEAASRGLEVSSLLEQEVQSKVPPVTDEQVDAFYEANKNRIKQPKEQAADRIRQYLEQTNARQLTSRFLDELRGKAGVTILLDPPRIDVAAEGDPSRGPADAPITIVEFSDFQCPYCTRVNTTLDTLRARYGDKVRIVFRDFPLAFHKEAPKAAEAAQCAHDQGRFWDYHDLLFANQRALAVEKLKEYAGQLGLEQAAFDECLDSGRHASEVREDMAEGGAAGVTGTPAFFINGIFLSGAQPLEKFTDIIDQELRRLGIPAGQAGAGEAAAPTS